MDAKKQTILDEAAKITSTDRQEAYAHPRENFGCIASMWTAYFSKTGRSYFTPRDVANMFALVKIARDAHCPKRDNLVDLAGYARCAEMLEEPSES